MSEPIKLTELIKDNKFTCSFEITPDVKKDELCGLEKQPAFYSITWHAKSHQCKDLDIEPLKLACFLRAQNHQVLLHLSCDMMKKHFLEKVLTFLQEIKICNLFLVLGESYDPNLSEFQSTVELISYIRKISGQYFCLGVAGFCEFNDGKMAQLKGKVDAGADFIITQAFFEAKIYNNFIEQCHKIGINVPIIAGIFIFENYKQLSNFIEMCKVKVSPELLQYAKENEGKEESGKEIIKEMIQNINTVHPSTHFHFFTLNKVKSTADIITQIKLDIQ